MFDVFYMGGGGAGLGWVRGGEGILYSTGIYLYAPELIFIGAILFGQAARCQGTSNLVEFRS
jgi:hypothetical protein